MTIHPRPTLFALLLLPLLIAGTSPCAAGGPEKLPPLPDGVVAIVGKRQLTFDLFCVAVVEQALQEISQQKAGPRMILEQLIEESMVYQECKRLGINVTRADVDKQWNDWDRRLRVSSNGARTLRDSLREQGTTEREFRVQILHILRKERIARDQKYLGKLLPRNENAKLQQIGIVIAKLRENTKVVYGIETSEHRRNQVQPAKLPPNQLVTVNGEPITTIQFGRALIVRLSAEKVRGYLDRECKTALMTLEGMKLTDSEFDAEVEHLKELWPLQRELQREELWSTVSFDERFKADFKGSVDDARRDRYVRGLLGLVRKMRKTVTEDEMRAEFEKQKDARLGEHILVDDIRIAFAQKSGLYAGVRNYKEARRIAGDLVRRLAAGETFEKVASAINKKQDRSIQAKKIRLYKPKRGRKGKSEYDRDLELYRQASRMRDGDTASPFDTLSAVHLLRRDGVRPARTFEEVREHLRDVVAKRKARQWIEERIKNPEYVRVRWPLEERKFRRSATSPGSGATRAHR